MSTLPTAFERAIRAQFGSDVLSTDPHDLAEYGRDWTREHEPAPAAIAFPRTTDDAARLVALCRQHNVAIVPSGGRTGLAGGAVASRGELVVSMVRMNRIDPVDPLAMTVRVQAGAVTQAVHEHAHEHGLTWPVDFAAKGSSCIGGNIATNAGGVNVIRYGQTRHWVLGLQVVTASGAVLELNGELEKNNTGLDLRQLFTFGGHLLVSRSDFPARHAYLVSETLDRHGGSIPGARMIAAVGKSIPPHEGTLAYGQGLPVPEIEN